MLLSATTSFPMLKCFLGFAILVDQDAAARENDCYNCVDMTRKDLIKFRARRPFVPFRIMLKDGDAIDILKPTSIGFGKTQIHMFYPDLRRHRVVHINEVAAATLLEQVQ